MYVLFYSWASISLTKGKLCEPFVGLQTGAATVSAVWSFLKNLKIELSYDPVIPVPGIHLKKLKTLIQNNTSTPMFIAALFTVAKIWKQPKCPSVGKWIKQLWDIYTVEYYLAIKKKKILALATAWMDLENIRLNEISQSEKDKYHMISLI